MIQKTIQHILNNYVTEKESSPFEGNSLAKYIRNDAVDYIQSLNIIPNDKFKIKGSAGQSRWADVPWIAVFDLMITNSATRGYYIVYLFSADMRRVYLSLNQGATAVEKEFKKEAINELRRRAKTARARLSDIDPDFAIDKIDLSSNQNLPKEYEAGHIAGKVYYTNNLPNDDVFLNDLDNLLREYLKLTARGGVSPSLEVSESDEDEGNRNIEELKKYRYHRTIERRSHGAKEAKKIHGFTCQICGFNFQETYGELGKDYIEAHHLIPISSLPEGEIVKMDPENDFCVLCANCHRMIHRSKYVGDIEKFRREHLNKRGR